MNTELEKWVGKFGDEYFWRNKPDPEIVNKRSKVFRGILEPLMPLGILEVGCNVGLNLLSIGNFVGQPNYFAGIEPNERVARIAQMAGLKVYPDIGEDLIFPDHSFDLAFTCGVLIHNKLAACQAIVREMKRVARRYLLFMEYYSDTDEQIPYRDGVYLCKRNWPKYFREWNAGNEVARGRAGKDQGFDDVHWWVYKKGADGI